MKLFNSENAHWYRRDGEAPGEVQSAECRVQNGQPDETI
jgi:hypothetical protein